MRTPVHERDIGFDCTVVIGHIFVTFTGSNELRVENIPDETLVEDFRQTIPFEWPHGLANEEHRSHRWRAQFGGTPWSSSGSDSIR